MTRVASAALAFATLAPIGLAALAASCDSPRADEPCTDIPAGGCPLSHGVACDDPTCVAVYACGPGNTWALDHTCPARDASATSTPDAAGVDGGAVDASIDAPPGAYGGPGCGPLEPPDCSLGFALACPSKAEGCCDCEDLYVCNNGGWDVWGACADGGVVESR